MLDTPAPAARIDHAALVAACLLPCAIVGPAVAHAMLEAAREIAGLELGVWWFALLTVPAGLWLGLWFAHQHRTLTPWWKCVLMPLIVSGSGAAVVFVSDVLALLVNPSTLGPLVVMLDPLRSLLRSAPLSALLSLVALVRALFQSAEGPRPASALKRHCALVTSLVLTALWMVAAR